MASYRNELDCLMTVWAASFRDEVAVLGVDKDANPSAKKPITISCNFVFENRANATFDVSLRSVANNRAGQWLHRSLKTGPFLGECSGITR